MSLTSWWKRRLSLTDPKGWPGSPARTGRTVTVDSAMSVSAFWASVRLISQTLGTTSLGFFKRQDDGGREAQQKHPLYRVLHDDPNPDQTAAEFWEGMAASLLVFGNGFARKQMNDGKVIGLDFLSAVPTPNHVRWVIPLRLRLGGPLVYRVQWATGYEDVPPEEIFHIRGFGFGGDVGLPVLTYAREALATAMAAEEVTEKTFREGLRLKGFFTTPDSLTEDQRKQAEKVLVDRFSGMDGKSTGVLEAGVTFQAVNLSAHDAELTLLRRMSVEDVCRFLGVPPIMIGHASEGQTMWGTGVEQLLIQFYTTGLRPLMVRIEKAINKQLVSPVERETHYAEFNLDSLLRADSAGKATLYSNFVNNGIMTRNEVRSRENMSRKPGGDSLTVQSALVPLQDLGQAPATAAPPAPPQRPPLRVVQ